MLVAPATGMEFSTADSTPRPVAPVPLFELLDFDNLLKLRLNILVCSARRHWRFAVKSATR
jgi:hypothetical protein